MDEHVDAAAGFEDPLDDRLDGVAVAQVDGVVVDRGPGRFDGSKRAQRRVGSLDPGQLPVDEGGRRPLPRRLEPLEDRALQPLLVGGEGADVGISRVGGRTRSSRWNVPCDARARSAVIAVTMLPAAPVMAKTVSGPSSMPAGVGAESDLPQRHRPPLAGAVADLDRAGVAQGLLDEQVGHRFRGRAHGDVDRLHQRVGVLAPERLGEAGHGAAHRRLGTAGVVPVPAAEPGGRQEEGPWATDGVADVPQRGVEELHAPAQQLPPAGQVECTEQRLCVQGRKPVEAGDRTIGGERVEARGQVLGGGAPSTARTATPALLEAAGERRTAAAVVEHDDDPAALAQCEAGRSAQLERRAQHGGRDAAGDRRRLFVVALDEPGGRSGDGSAGRGRGGDVPAATSPAAGAVRPGARSYTKAITWRSVG